MMRIVDRCLVCGCERLKGLYRSNFHGTWREAASYFLTNREKAVHGEIVQCHACRFAFTRVQFLPEEYDEIYRAVAENISSDKQAADTIRFNQLLDYVAKYCPKGTFADFGGADGAFGALAKARGYSPSVMDLRYGQEEFLEVNVSAPNRLDFVTAWDVLEHIPDLDRQMEVLSGAIVERGYVFFTVPDFGSSMAKIFRSKWNCILLEHLWYFNKNNIATYGEKFGLQLLEIDRFPFPVDMNTLLQRVAQTFHVPKIRLSGAFGQKVVTLNTGLMRGVFQKTGG